MEGYDFTYWYEGNDLYLFILFISGFYRNKSLVL